MREKAEQKLAEAFLASYPEEAAAILEKSRPREAARELNRAVPESAAGILARMSPLVAAETLSAMSRRSAFAALEALDLDSAAAIMRALEDAERHEFLEDLPSETSRSLSLLLSYPPASAGAFMEPRVLALAEDSTVSDALKRLRRSGELAFHYLYVQDRAGKLVGAVSLRRLSIMPGEARLDSAMRPASMRLDAGADLNEVVSHPGWRELHALPVVDREGRLLGVLRYRTMRQIEENLRPSRQGRSAEATAEVLGELYTAGMLKVVEAAAAILAPPRPPENGKTCR